MNTQSQVYQGSFLPNLHSRGFPRLGTIAFQTRRAVHRFTLPETEDGNNGGCGGHSYLVRSQRRDGCPKGSWFWRI